MTATELYRPRHAAHEAPVSEPVATDIDTPTHVLPVIPAQRVGYRAGPMISGIIRPELMVASVAPQVPVPPAGLLVDHPPVPRRRARVGTLATVVAILFIFGLLVAGFLALTSPTEEVTSQPASTPSTAPVATPKQLVGQWSVEGGTTRSQAITDDLNAVADAGRRYDVSGMNSACRSLQSSIESAQAFDPIPDTQAQASWSSALAHGARSATYCIAGTDSTSAPLIESATTEMQNMTDDLNKTTDRLSVISGSN